MQTHKEAKLLDKCKVLCELEQLSDKLFFDWSPELEQGRIIWETVVGDATFNDQIRQAMFHLPLPLWQGTLDATFNISLLSQALYTVVGIDGSQIYPDKHQGSPCFLINIGTVVLRYGVGGSVQFSSEPHVFASMNEEQVQGPAVDMVNCKRQELEFDKGIMLLDELGSHESCSHPALLLFDGSLIFWHLESKEQDIRMFFLNKYCESLMSLFFQKRLCAGYISLPKNKDLVNLLRFAQQDGSDKNTVSTTFQHINDVHICSLFLKPFSRTNVFMHQSKLCQSYPCFVRPYFFYLHVGSEIVRIELPSWIAQSDELINLVATIVLDNAIKGQGYPVALAEAHEQAVVKGPDRDFFYQLIQKIGFDQNRSMTLSQKVLKKRGITI